MLELYPLPNQHQRAQVEDAHFRYQIYDYSEMRVILDIEHRKYLRIVEALNGFF